MEVFPFTFTQQGVNHAAAGVPNQGSALAFRFGECLVALMADGMGSASLAQEASRTIVERARDTALMTLVPRDEQMVRATAEPCVRSLFAAAFNGLQQAALGNGWEIDQLKTTFMAVVYHVRTRTMWWGACGDGGICGWRDGEAVLVTNPHKGEANSSQTTEVLQCAWDFGETTVDAFFMMTDGLFDYLTAYEGDCLAPAPIAARLFEDARAVAPDKAVERLEHLFSAVSYDDVAVDGNPFSFVTDDRSAIAVLPVGPSGGDKHEPCCAADANAPHAEDGQAVAPKAHACATETNSPANDPVRAQPPKPAAPQAGAAQADPSRSVHDVAEYEPWEPEEALVVFAGVNPVVPGARKPSFARRPLRLFARLRGRCRTGASAARSPHEYIPVETRDGGDTQRRQR